eukprot:GHVP01035680.1.p2 GENE.GHVP01035680.1~~GHVP01035680.1.p2  ORF type:complete len:296 (+),score=63.87 GHVP01035680.1:988-1875(+)
MNKKKIKAENLLLTLSTGLKQFIALREPSANFHFEVPREMTSSLTCARGGNSVQLSRNSKVPSPPSDTVKYTIAKSDRCRILADKTATKATTQAEWKSLADELQESANNLVLYPDCGVPIIFSHEFKFLALGIEKLDPKDSSVRFWGVHPDEQNSLILVKLVKNGKKTQSLSLAIPYSDLNSEEEENNFKKILNVLCTKQHKLLHQNAVQTAFGKFVKKKKPQELEMPKFWKFKPHANSGYQEALHMIQEASMKSESTADLQDLNKKLKGNRINSVPNEGVAFVLGMISTQASRW